MAIKYPLHIHISTFFLVVILAVGGTIAGVGFKMSRDMLESVATDLVERVAGQTREDIERLINTPEMAIGLISHSGLSDAKNYNERIQRLPILRESLLRANALSSIYIGYANGDFFFMRRLHDDSERQLFNAPDGTQFMVQAIDRSGEKPNGRYAYFGGNLNLLRVDEKPDYPNTYDPRTRNWYKTAIASDAPIKTAPYVFYSSQKIGLTLAERDASHPDRVIGADILIDTLGENLRKKKWTPNSELALINMEGQVLAHQDQEHLLSMPDHPGGKPALKKLDAFGHPALTAISPLLHEIQGKPSLSLRQQINNEEWLLSLTQVSIPGSPPIYLAVAVPENELLAAAVKLRKTALIITLFVIMLAIPLAWWLAHVISKPLRLLNGAAERIRRFDFSGASHVPSIVTEIDGLSHTMNDMSRAIRRFLDVSALVSEESNFDRLMPMLLSETIAAADASAGLLYLADTDALQPMALIDGTTSSNTVDLPEIKISQATGLLRHALSEGKTQGANASQDELSAYGLADLARAKQATYLLAIPLLNRQHELVGSILLLRDKPIDDAQRSFVSNLAVPAANALETKELIKAQKSLFEAFIQLIAAAIDAKSPYTGGHCARVPELTKMLAAAASEESDGPFKDFSLDERDWECVHIAAWLHDCGKVTTPEYVVDKATKLETIYDRIHEIRMRFEVIKRDAEIACLKSIAQGVPEQEARDLLQQTLAQIDSDFAFVATCNEGDEFMAPESLARLRTIAERTWVRTLSDQIGISIEEKQRKSNYPPIPTPATERLLDDKPEHVIARPEYARMSENNPWGFKLRVPEALYNRGELYNLSVVRGTLSDEERYKINEHIVQTIVMLSTLPFPKHLRGISEIAGAHHEKMDGTGYPRGLKREEMSPVARMMAIADIFEALTAVDRPYKKAKKLSEAIRIMSFMKKDGHIDPDLFDLFLRHGIYRNYAERFMKPAQIDEVDITPYLSPAVTP